MLNRFCFLICKIYFDLLTFLLFFCSFLVLSQSWRYHLSTSTSASSFVPISLTIKCWSSILLLFSWRLINLFRIDWYNSWVHRLANSTASFGSPSTPNGQALTWRLLNRLLLWYTWIIFTNVDFILLWNIVLYVAITLIVGFVFQILLIIRR